MKVCAWVLVGMAAAVGSAAGDDLIVPGVRVGPVSRISTEASLLRELGKAAVKADVDIGEGMTEPGLIIYPDDSGRRLAVVWNGEKPAHPASIFICYNGDAAVCRWRTAGGIGMGTTLRDLERRNGGAFEMVVWGSDVGGNVVSYLGGKLEQELRGNGVLGLNLAPRIDATGAYLPKLTEREFAAVRGERFVKSSDTVLQKLNPAVASMNLEFPRK
jgi:hypothetical protein